LEEAVDLSSDRLLMNEDEYLLKEMEIIKGKRISELILQMHVLWTVYCTFFK
jgi:hypothetical protein